MRHRLDVRLTPADVGRRVVIRWRPGPEGSTQMTDVLGTLEQADDQSFTVRRTRDGTTGRDPRTRPPAGKVMPPAPQHADRARIHNRPDEAGGPHGYRGSSATGHRGRLPSSARRH